jgi:peptidoglycan/LPS O-acetylase OafA/YrhL
MSMNRILPIDSLRAIAALLVLWHHSSEIFMGYLPDSEFPGAFLAKIASVFDFGRIGVVIFFCVSGYVIPSSLVSSSSRSLRNFAISRFFRLFPAYWLSIPLGFFACFYLWGRPITTFDWLVNFTMFPTWLGGQPALGLYWTLQIELVFYVLCGALFSFGLLNSRSLMGILALVLSLVFIASFSAVFGLPFRVPQFIDGNMWPAAFLSMMFFGAVLRRFHDDRDRASLFYLCAYSGIWLVLFPARGLSMFIASNDLHPDLFKLFFSHSLGILSFLMLLLVLPIQSRFCVYMGKISYSIYLYHPIVLYLLLWVLIQTVGEDGRLRMHLGVSIVLVACLTILLSGFLFRYIESPAIRLGKRFRVPLRSTESIPSIL